MLRKLLIVVCLLATVPIAFGQKKKKKSKEKEETAAVITYKEIGSPMPPLRVVSPQKKVITQDDVANDANLLVMMFNPTCDHCIQTTQMLRDNLDRFEKTKIVLMATPNQIDNLGFFRSITEYNKFPKLQVGVDSAGFLDKTFLYQHLPQINIYDKHRKLIKVFTGDITIDSLKGLVE